MSVFEGLPHMCGYLQRPKECFGYPGGEVSGSCELPDKGVGNRTWVFQNYQGMLITTEQTLQP